MMSHDEQVADSVTDDINDTSQNREKPRDPSQLNPQGALQESPQAILGENGAEAPSEQPRSEESPRAGTPQPEVPQQELSQMEKPGQEQTIVVEKFISETVSFASLDLPDSILRAITDLGFKACTPIQARSLPVTLDGLDVIGKAQTGTGKTAAFLISIFSDLLKNPLPEDERFLGEPRALVIAPTRELVMQIAADAEDLGKYTGLTTTTLVGGIDYEKQLRVLDHQVVDIVVATPGRLLDFMQSRKLNLGMVEMLVIDEADRMLDMGFIPQVKQIVNATPGKDRRQTMLFSATFTDDILNLAARWTHDPVKIEVAPEKVATDTVDQRVYLVTTDQKINLLYNLIQSDAGEKIIVFSNRRDQVRNLADKLYRLGLDVGMLSGEVAQPKRVKTLEKFKTGATQVLVATDVAGRGLHIDDITHVVNYTLPQEAEDYVHRIGRTGRAGSLGTSVSFACEDDSFMLPEIEEKLGMKLNCEHPPEELLKPVPDYVRPSKLKPADKARKKSHSGRSGGRRR